jgi:hypothetical protein
MVSPGKRVASESISGAPLLRCELTLIFEKCYIWPPAWKGFQIVAQKSHTLPPFASEIPQKSRSA